MVAKAGYDALMAGKDKVVSGFKNKIMAAIADALPDSVAAQVHRGMSKPGSASWHTIVPDPYDRLPPQLQPVDDHSLGPRLNQCRPRRQLACLPPRCQSNRNSNARPRTFRQRCPRPLARVIDRQSRRGILPVGLAGAALASITITELAERTSKGSAAFVAALGPTDLRLRRAEPLWRGRAASYACNRDDQQAETSGMTIDAQFHEHLHSTSYSSLPPTRPFKARRRWRLRVPRLTKSWRRACHCGSPRDGCP